MAKENILRIKRSDSPDDFILVKVTKSGSSELDLKFVATEGEAPYRGSVKTAQINKLRAKNYHGDDDEWKGILAYALGQKQSASVPEDHKSGLEIAATVKQDEDDESEREIFITLRKRIDTITQRLGTITLKQDDDQAIQLFDWTGVAIARGDELEDQLASLTAKYEAVESTINKLNSQLEELIKAKSEHDDQLIAKFAQLLNEKKLKIRNQQRLLGSAKVDPAKVDEMEASPAPSEPTDGRRRGKRKAQEPAPSSESEDGFDTMDVDKVGKKDNDNAEMGEGEGEEDVSTEEERQETPEPLEDEETATEDEAGERAQPQPPSQTPGASEVKRATRASSKQPESSSTAKKASSPPPRRELPFTRKRAAKPAPVEEGESDEDDEL